MVRGQAQEGCCYDEKMSDYKLYHGGFNKCN